MKFDEYAVQCSVLSTELVESLSKDDENLLYKALEGTTQETFWAWREAQSSLVYEYIRAAPSVRARSKKFQPDRGMLVLAAAQVCKEAEALLKTISTLEPNQGYREMAASAGEAFDKIMWADHGQWPFDCASPWID